LHQESWYIIICGQFKNVAYISLPGCGRCAAVARVALLSNREIYHLKRRGVILSDLTAIWPASPALGLALCRKRVWIFELERTFTLHYHDFEEKRKKGKKNRSKELRQF